MATSNQHSRQRRGLKAAGVALGLALAARMLLTQRQQEADLRGQVALVTGGSRGLGLAISRELARQGCRLAICARDELELARARADLEQHGAEVLAVPCDVSDRDQVATMVDLVTNRYGAIDILVNNAGIIVVAPAEAVTHDDLERVMATNFWGTVHPTLAVLPGMRARGAGRIVNITSIGGKIAVPHMLPYTCAKFGAVGFSSGLRAELLNTGVMVTTVVPGLMRTGSYLHAEFGGDQEDEYRWFALGASAPYPVTVSAERAARMIVQAARRGQAECSFPFTATLAARAAGLLPSQTANVLSVVDQLLPEPLPLPTGTTEGMAIEPAVNGGMFSVMTTMGRSAAASHNQLATSRSTGG